MDQNQPIAGDQVAKIFQVAKILDVINAGVPGAAARLMELVLRELKKSPRSGCREKPTVPYHRPLLKQSLKICQSQTLAINAQSLAGVIPCPACLC